MIIVTPYKIAKKFIGVKEVPGHAANPQIMAMLQLDNDWPDGDEVPWCSAFVNYIAWLCDLQRTRSLRARSWLLVGDRRELDEPWPYGEVRQGYNIVVLKTGNGNQPGPDVIDAPGHVGFYAGRDRRTVSVLGGNQADAVSIVKFPIDQVLGVRRLTHNTV